MSTWKKLTGSVLAVLGILMLGMSRPAQAATTDIIHITVTVDVVSVNIATTTWAIGSVVPGSINISSAIPVENDGNRQEDYQLSLTYSPGWTIGTTTTPATNTFVLLALFTTTPTGSVTDSIFGESSGTDDVITTSAQTCTTTLFGITGETDANKGFDVAALDFQDMFLNFRAPTSNTFTAEQSMTVTVTALAG